MRLQCELHVTDSKPSEKTYLALSWSHQEELENYMKLIEDFVYDVRTTKFVEFEIRSDALKKTIQRLVKKAYLNTGIFVDFILKTTKLTVRKTR